MKTGKNAPEKKANQNTKKHNGAQAANRQDAQKQNTQKRNTKPLAAGKQDAANTVEQNAAGQNTVGQDAAGQNAAGQNTVGQDVAEQNAVGQNTVGQDAARQNTARQNAEDLKAEKAAAEAAAAKDAAGGPAAGRLEKARDEALRILKIVGRAVGAAGYAAMLLWYCSHPDYYGESDLVTLFTSPRTWFMIIVSTAMITLCLVPNHLSDRLNRKLSWTWCALAPFAVYFSLLYLNATKFKIKFFELNKIALFFTFWFLFGMLLLFLVITGSIRVSAMVLAVPIGLLGIFNCFVIEFRGMAISGGDIFSIGTALTVSNGYQYTIDWYIFMEAFLTFTICVVSLKLRGFKLFYWKQRVALLLIWLVSAASFYHICCKTSFLQDHDIRSEGYTHQLRYKQFDMIFTTLCTCFYLAADKPEGYSVEKVHEIAAPYVGSGDKDSGSGDGDEAESSTDTNRSGSSAAAGNAAGTGDSAMGSASAAAGAEKASQAAGASADADVQTPNIIVLMNESLADYSDIGKGLEFSEDYMPFLHSLTENTIKGTAYASIFGANTPNSEYEFLTGNTMGFLPPSSVGFHLFVRGAMPSLASELKAEGYYTLAIHPYRGTNYRRNIVYPQIGFEKYYARVNFTSPKYIRNFISDEELVNRIILEYEKNNARTDVPLFSYNVTVQDHGGYSMSNTKNLDNSIKIRTPGVDWEKTQVYANLVKASDEAFEKLVMYFSKQKEPTVIIMFGDHQPNLGENTYEYLIGNEEELTPEELMEKYKIPFVAWANYDIEEETIEKTSLNYLYSVLADRLDLPMTGFQKYLLDLSEDIPVLAAGGYWTKDGDFYTLDDEESPYFERINDYHILEYNYIFGKGNRYLDFFS